VSSVRKLTADSVRKSWNKVERNYTSDANTSQPPLPDTKLLSPFKKDFVSWFQSVQHDRKDSNEGSRCVARSRQAARRAMTENLIGNVTAFEIPHVVPSRPLLKAGWRQGEGLCCEEVVLRDREEVEFLWNSSACNVPCIILNLPYVCNVFTTCYRLR
jgi:hypothetical protein